MEIILKTGKGEVALRGNDGVFELCWPQVRKNKEGKTERVFVAERWYVSLPAAFNALLAMKVSNSTATTLEELGLAIDDARRELTEIWPC